MNSWHHDVGPVWCGSVALGKLPGRDDGPSGRPSRVDHHLPATPVAVHLGVSSWHGGIEIT